MHESCRKTLSELLDSVERGNISSAEVTAAARERAREVDPVVNAFVEIAAPSSSDLGRLRGLPVAVKDQFVDADRIPTCGSRARPPRMHGTAAVISRIRRSGGTVMGYTNMHEWGVGTTSSVSAFGPVRNPWDAGRVAGGSSGGSAAAVAAGVVGAAIGTDAGGSIRIPAACCRIVGFKPTRAAVATEGFVGDGNPIDHIGVLARCTQDARLLFEVLTDTRRARELPRRLRIGIARAPFSDLHPGVEKGLTGVVDSLASRYRVADVHLDGWDEARTAVGVLLLTFIARSFGTELESALRDLHPKTAAVIRRGARTTGDELARAHDARTRIERGWLHLFETVDVVVTPTIASLPPPPARPVVDLPSGPVHFDVTNIALNGPMNLGGVPALSLPCADAGDGWTASLTVTGAPGRDDLVLAVGEMIEDLTDRRFVNAVADVS